MGGSAASPERPDAAAVRVRRADRDAMCFRIAESPAEMRCIKPGPVTVHALIDGDLYEIDMRLLDRASIDRLFEWSLAESRSKSGIAGPGGTVEIEYRVEPQPVPAGGRGGQQRLLDGHAPVYRAARLEPPRGGPRPDRLPVRHARAGRNTRTEHRVHIPRRAPEPRRACGVIERAAQRGDRVVRIADDRGEPAALPALETTLEILPDRHGRVVDPVSGELLPPGDDDVHPSATSRIRRHAAGRRRRARSRTPIADSASVRIGRAIVGTCRPRPRAASASGSS